MATQTRPLKPALSAPFPSKSRIPYTHVVNATWASSTALFFGAVFILVVAGTTHDRPTSSNYWVSSAPILISFGGVVLKAGLGALLGVAAYQHLWYLLARGDTNSEKRNAGLKVREIESLHLASRLSVGMLAMPSARIGWFTGIVGLLWTAALVPTLQAGVTITSRVDISPTNISIQHTQLHNKMALVQSAAGIPSGATAQTKRSAMVAIFGENMAYSYTKKNVTGKLTSGTISYVDAECNMTASLRPRDYAGGEFYNFTSNFTDKTDSVHFVTPFYGALTFTATLFNNTHDLKHSCFLRPARGVCSTHLTEGVSLMKNLHCIRSSWMNLIPIEPYGPAWGFYAIASAFIAAFTGKATIGASGTLNEDSIFITAAAIHANYTSFNLRNDFMSHVQRTLWHIPIGAGYNETWMDMQEEQTELVIKIKYEIIITVVVITIIMGIASVVYLIVMPNEVLGRLMRDSLVHSLTVGSMRGPGIHGASIASLETVLEQVGNENYSYGVVVPSTGLTPGVLGIKNLDDKDVKEIDSGRPIEGMYYGGR